ncbi:MAG TPA: F0F1 ATP synthase subunit B [Solirubrobacteraceae bacterium]|nr:F0F1 ATP synthase subunit B [Solirubrobacteraceae bacterium]
MIASSNFLVPNATLIVEVVAFLIVLGFLGRYVLPVLNKQLGERQDQIQSALEAADAARREAAAAAAQNQATLDEARREARDIITQANKAAERIATQAEERGRQEYDRLVGAAEAEIRAARQRAVDDVSAKVSGLVMSVARQVVGREVDAQAHRALIDEAVATLRASEATSTPAGGSAGASS